MKKRKEKFLSLAAVILTAVLFVCSFRPEHAEGASYLSPVCTTSEMIHENFPESYWEDLDALLLAHPNWSFQAFHVGVGFDEAIAADTEMKPGRNLVEKETDKTKASYKPTSWFSTESGYNWAGNEWTVLSAPNWVQASEAAVRYCMDPRNFLNEEQIYQFQDHLSQATLPVVQYLFASVGGTFWTRSGEESDLYYEIEVEVPVETSSEESSEEESETESGSEAGSSESTSGSEESRIKSETGSEESSSSENSSESSSEEPKTKIVTQKVYLTYAEALIKIANEVGMSPAILTARIIQEQGLGTSPMISGTKEFTVTEGGETRTVSGYYNYFNINATDGEGVSNYELIYQTGLTEAYEGGWNTRYKALLGGAQKFYANYVAKGQYTYYTQKYNVDSSSPRQYWGQYMQNIVAPQSEAKKTYQAYLNSGEIDSEQLFIIPVFSSMPEEKAEKPTKDGNPNYKLNYIYLNSEALENFNTDTLSYSLTVESEVSSIDLLIKTYADTTTITVGETETVSQFSETVPLEYGDNIFTILCTAENGDDRTYTLSVTREGENMFGDVNADGTWDIYDISFMQSHILQYSLLTGKQLEVADINGDGAVDIYDISYIVSYMLKYSEEIPQRQKGQALVTETE